MNNLIRLAPALVLAMTIAIPLTTQAAEQMKGGPHLLHLLGIKTEAQAEALKPGDKIAMVCAKCQSVMMHNVETQKGHIKVMTVGEKHLYQAVTARSPSLALARANTTS